LNPTITVGVYRRLDNRLEGLADDSPRAKELHDRRRRALHEVLDGQPGVKVIDWGDANDEKPHEFVLLTISVVASATFKYAIVPGVMLLGEKLVEAAAEEGASSS
jgi:hypothetical protein